MKLLVRKIIKPFKPLLKKIYPSYFKYDTISYWINREGPTYYNNYSVNYDGTKQADLQEKYLIEQMKKLEWKSILEYGCGYGRILKLVEDSFPGNEIYGCDISPHQLKNSAKVLGSNSKCNLFIVDGKTIPKEDNRYDIVYICNVFQHQTHKLINTVRDEVLRVTGKYILLMEPNHTSAEVAEDKKIENTVDKTCYKHNHTDYYTSKGCRIIRNDWVPEIGNSLILIEKLSG